MKHIKKYKIVIISLAIILFIYILLSISSLSLLGNANWIKTLITYNNVHGQSEGIGIINEDPLIIVSLEPNLLEAYLADNHYEEISIEGIEFERYFTKDQSIYRLEIEQYHMFGQSTRYQLELVEADMLLIVVPIGNQFMAAYKDVNENVMNHHFDDKYEAINGIITYKENGLHMGLNILPIISYQVKSYADMGTVKVITYETIFLSSPEGEKKTQDFQITLQNNNGKWFINQIDALLY